MFRRDPISHAKQDQHGNVVAVLDQFGALAEKYTYDAFGKPKVFDKDGNERTSGSAIGNRFMYTGREWIQELGIYDYRHRMYHPGLGRFLQTDPLDLQTEGEKLSAGQKALFSPGGSAPEAFSSSEMNLYRYCGDDPMDRSDPLGLLTYEIIGGESQFRKLVEKTLRDFKKTEIGKEIFAKEGNLLILADKSGTGPGSDPGKFVTGLDATSPDFIGKNAPIRKDAPLEIPKGPIDKVRLVVLTHELGHSVLGLADETKGVNTLNNVRDVENRMRRELHLDERNTYHGRPIITP